MDIQPEELQTLTVPEIMRESIQIPSIAPKPFYLLTLTLIFPLSFVILAHSIFTHPVINRITRASNIGLDSSSQAHEWAILASIQFSYLLFVFTFSLLATSAVVFTVASIYTSKPVSFSSTMFAIPKVFKRVFVTFLWVCLLMFCYNLILLIGVVVSIVAVQTRNTILFAFAMIVIFVMFLVVHVYITALWHLASVVSVLEPVYGFSAMKKSYELLKGKAKTASIIVLMYLVIVGLVEGTFGIVVVRGGNEYRVLVRILVGGVLVGTLVVVNLVGLLVQSVFYYVCKSYHHQGIDKTLLYDHLGGYIGEYVPLKSDIQMEGLDI